MQLITVFVCTGKKLMGGETMGKARRRLAMLMALTMSVSNIAASSFTAFGAEYAAEDTSWEEEVLLDEAEDTALFTEEEAEVSDAENQADAEDDALIDDGETASDEGEGLEEIGEEDAEPETDPEVVNDSISVGETKTITVTGREVHYLYFTPLESGRYKLYSTGEGDTKVSLYDVEDMSSSKEDDDDNGEESNFSLTSDLDAGLSYAYKVGFFSEDQTGTFDVTLEKVEVEPEDETETETEINREVQGTLSEGDNDIIAGENDFNWYAFTPETTAEYCFENVNGIAVVDSKGNYASNEVYTKYSLEAGRKYYIGLSGAQWVNEQNSYQYVVSIRIAHERGDISIALNEQAVFLEKITTAYDIFNSVNISEEYDGLTETFSGNGTDEVCAYFTDNDSNYVYARLFTDDDTEVKFSEVLKAGTYIIKVMSKYEQGELLASISLTVLTMEEAAQGALTAGDNAIVAGENNTYNWYSFTPEMTGTYYFANINSRRILDSNGVEVNSHNNNYNKISLEAGQQYYVGLSGQQWDSESGSYAYTYTITIKYAPDILRIEPQSGYRIVEDTVLNVLRKVNGISVDYEDNETSAEIDFSNGGWSGEYLNRNDDYGNWIYCRLLDASGEPVKSSYDYDNKDTVAPGTYTLQLATDYEFTEHVTETPLTVFGLEELEALPLTEDTKVVTANRENPVYYTISGSEKAKFYLAYYYSENSYPTWDIITKDASGIHRTSGGNSIDYDPAKSCYIVFTKHDHNGNQIDGSIEIDFRKIPQFKTLTVKPFGTDIYANGMTIKDFLRSLRFSYTLDNGETGESSWSPNWYVNYDMQTSGYGLFVNEADNQMSAVLTKDGETVEVAGYDYLNTELETGEYTLTLSNEDGEELTKISFTVKEFAVQNFPLLQEGKNTFANAVNNSKKYYRFIPDRDGKYKFSIDNGDISLTLHDQNDEELECDYSQWNEWVYTLKAGQTYRADVNIDYVYSNRTLTMNVERMPGLTGFTVSSEADGKTYVRQMTYGEDQVLIKLTYDNGSVKIMKTSGGTSDGYGNQIDVIVYRDGEKLSRNKGLPGTYQIYAEVAGERKLAATYTLKAIDDVAKSVEVGTQQQFNDVDGQVFVAFTTGEKGSYRISTDTDAQSMELYSTDSYGSIAELYGNNTVTGDLEANTQYFVKIQVADIFDTVNVNVEKLPDATQITAQLLEDTLIAGLDNVIDYLEAAVSYGDETRSHLQENGYDAYNGSVLFYTKSDDEQLSDIPNRAGEYTVYAGYTPAVSGSAVHSVYGAVITDKSLESGNTVQVKLTLPRVEELEQLTLDTEVKVPGGVTRQLYGFTAPQDGYYTTQMTEGRADLSFYQIDDEEQRLVSAGKGVSLQKGESIILVAQTAVAGSFRIVKAEEPETEPEPGNEPISSNTVPDRFEGEGSYSFNMVESTKYVAFTPDKTGIYQFDLKVSTGDAYFTLYSSEENGRDYLESCLYEEDDIRSVTYTLAAGTTYELRINCNEPSKLVMDITCLGDKSPKPIDVELATDTTAYVAREDGERFSEYLRVKLTYDNQSISTQSIYIDDYSYKSEERIRYGYELKYSLDPVSENEEKQIYSLSIMAEDRSGETILEKSLEVSVPKASSLPKLTMGENQAAYHVDGSEMQSKYYSFTPEETGYYMLSSSASDQVEMSIGVINDIQRNRVDSSYYEVGKIYGYGAALQGGKTYIIEVNTYAYEGTGASGTGVIRITKGNAVKSLSIVKQPDQMSVIPGTTMADLDGMEVAVTYADGTEGVYTYGTEDWYEHLYTEELVWLSDTRAKVMINAGYRSTPLYLKGDASLIDTLPKIKVGRETEIRPVAAFTPEATGTYTIKGYNVIMDNGTKYANYQVTDTNGRRILYGEDALYYDDANVDHMVRYYYLNEGQTYLIENTIDGSIALTVFRSDASVEEKLETAEETIKQAAEGNASAEEALEALLGSDESEGLTSQDIAAADGGLEMVQNLEEVIVANGITVESSEVPGESRTFTIEEPTAKAISEDAVESEETAEVKGAAVTVAKVLSERSDLAAGTYSAQLEVTGEGEQDAASDQADRIYQMDISLYITKKTEGQVEKIDAAPQQLKAPIEITIPIPEEYQYYEQLKLYHVTESGEEEVPATVNGNTMTFVASSLSPYLIKATGCTHNWVEKENVAATCTEEGHVTQECTICKETKTETLAKVDHTKETVAGKAATCSEAGLSDGEKCSVCGTVLKEQEEIPATGDHKKETVAGKAATCSEAGLSDGEKCSVCGTVLKAQTEIKAKGHSFSEWTTTKEATVFEAQTQSRTCTVCKQTETRQHGSKLKATITTNAAGDKITLKTNQKTTGLKISGLAAGDSVSSITIDNAKAVTLSKVNTKAGTCMLKAKKLTGKKGKAVLTIKLQSGLEKKITITVQKKAVKTKSIAVEETTITLKKGQSYTIKPEIAPFTSTDKLSFSVKSKKIASVTKKGVVKAKAKGSTKITIKSGKKKKVITVVVTD